MQLMYVLIQLFFTLSRAFSISGTVCNKEMAHVSKQLFY